MYLSLFLLIPFLFSFSTSNEASDQAQSPHRPPNFYPLPPSESHLKARASAHSSPAPPIVSFRPFPMIYRTRIGWVRAELAPVFSSNRLLLLIRPRVHMLWTGSWGNVCCFFFFFFLLFFFFFFFRRGSPGSGPQCLLIFFPSPPFFFLRPAHAGNRTFLFCSPLGVPPPPFPLLPTSLGNVVAGARYQVFPVNLTFLLIVVLVLPPALLLSIKFFFFPSFLRFFPFCSFLSLRAARAPPSAMDDAQLPKCSLPWLFPFPSSPNQQIAPRTPPAVRPVVTILPWFVLFFFFLLQIFSSFLPPVPRTELAPKITTSCFPIPVLGPYINFLCFFPVKPNVEPTDVRWAVVDGLPPPLIFSRTRPFPGP